MRWSAALRKSAGVFGVATALALGVAGTATAAPADNKLIIYSTELQPLDQISNPSGCVNMPPLAHIVLNLTDHPVQAYAFPGCVGPTVWTIQPGFGAHTAGFGSVRS